LYCFGEFPPDEHSNKGFSWLLKDAKLIRIVG
jgi:hypothetical protein